MRAATQSALTQLTTIGRKSCGKVKTFLLDCLLRPERPWDMQRFGTYYGGWWIRHIDPKQGAAICVGAGADVSFDLELHRLGYRTYTVDPTPAAGEFVPRHAPQLSFLPVGVWHHSGEVAFAQDSTWGDSWAIEETLTERVRDVRRFRVLTVKDLIAHTGEDTVAILKLDIEGAEHQVIRSMIRDDVRPECFCVEFDDYRLHKVFASHHALTRYGYNLMQIEGLNHIYYLPRPPE